MVPHFSHPLCSPCTVVHDFGQSLCFTDSVTLPKSVTVLKKQGLSHQDLSPPLLLSSLGNLPLFFSPQCWTSGEYQGQSEPGFQLQYGGVWDGHSWWMGGGQAHIPFTCSLTLAPLHSVSGWVAASGIVRSTMSGYMGREGQGTVFWPLRERDFFARTWCLASQVLSEKMRQAQKKRACST